MEKKLGICIPYRNRESHLKVLLPHLTKFLNKKEITHQFYITHQTDDKLFNRGAMKNIAAKHAFEDGCDYVAFHDVDMLPENDNCDYSYPTEYPTHIATKLSKYKYKLNYEQYFGGVVLMTKEHIEKTNGYSNGYWDWGMEDDDLFWRCIYENLSNRNLFTEYKNINCINFNGIDSYIEIPKNIELHNVLSNSHTISILCNIDSQSEKYKEWLIGDEDRTFLEHPIFRHNSIDSYSIGFNSSRAVCVSVRNEKNELNYGWIKRNFNEWIWVTVSADVESGKLYFYSNDKLIKVLKNGVLEESYYTFTDKLKKLNSNFYIGKNILNTNKIAIDFLKGKIAGLKVWDKFTEKENIKNIIIEKAGSPFFELSLNDTKLKFNNTENTLENVDVYDNAIPHRREGRFLSLPHADEGFVDGKWAKGKTTAINEKRLFLEMKKEKLNYKEDGIAQIKYDLVSKEQIADNAWMINVKL
jgi:hypothetical protein